MAPSSVYPGAPLCTDHSIQGMLFSAYRIEVARLKPLHFL